MNSTRLLFQRVTIPLEGAGHLLNTLRLGRHLFNPHRLSDVLSAIGSHANESTIDITDHWNDYLAAGANCLSISSNLRLMKISGLVDSLKILRFEVPGSTRLYKSIVASLAESIDSENRLHELVDALSKSDLHEPILEEAVRSNLCLADPLSKTRVRLSHASHNPCEYLNGFLEMSEQQLISAGLSETELGKILCVCGNSIAWAIRDRLISTIEKVVRHRIVTNSLRATDRLRVLDGILAVGSMNRFLRPLTSVLERVTEEKFADSPDILSASQTVDLLFVFPSANVAKDAWTNLTWRINRDPLYLFSLDSIHCVRLVRVLGDRECIPPAVVSALIPSIRKDSAFQTSSEVSALADAVATLGWIEYPALTEAFFENFLSLASGKKFVNAADLAILLGKVVRLISVTDEKLVLNLLDKFDFGGPNERLETYKGLIDIARVNARQAGSRIGNVLVAKMLATDTSEFQRILECVSQSGSISLHSKLTQFSTHELMQLLEMSRKNTRDLLVNAELVSDCIAVKTEESISELLNCFIQLSRVGFPSLAVMNLLCERGSDLKLSEYVAFIEACAKTRLKPDSRLVAMIAQALHSAEVIANVASSLSALGLLNDSSIIESLTNRFVSSVDSCGEKAKVSCQFLSALFVSLQVPSAGDLAAILDIIAGGPQRPSRFECDVFSEMGHVLGNRVLLSYRALTAEQTDSFAEFGGSDDDTIPTRVKVGESKLSTIDSVDESGDTAVMIARPEDCYFDNSPSQLFKFKHFLVSRRVKNVLVRTWNQL